MILSDHSGDILEIGVASGRSLSFLLYVKEQFHFQNRIIGFDTFEGFPDSSLVDQSNPKLEKPTYKKYTQDFVEEYIRDFTNINLPFTNELRLVKGKVPETLIGFDFNMISLLHLDCDLYECHKESLNYLFKYFINGTYILLDDYGDEKWPGVRKAVDEFCIEFNQKVEKDNFGFHYIKISL